MIVRQFRREERKEEERQRERLERRCSSLRVSRSGSRSLEQRRDTLIERREYRSAAALTAPIREEVSHGVVRGGRRKRSIDRQ